MMVEFCFSIWLLDLGRPGVMEILRTFCLLQQSSNAEKVNARFPKTCRWFSNRFVASAESIDLVGYSHVNLLYASITAKTYRIQGETGCHVWIFEVGLSPNLQLTRQCESHWDNFD
ncbi:hypothetical protein TNIN_356241 [Trichonephila inaurata madagascariensis]|uniref:Uncharacterized protein n=1 Tax=Trichonephila inaurata madagascariensis TaxID=2747483 RepID=A0A8X6XFE0_9ARAC|nr:hypothetical protein TNIN_356241 [Trichonephila inaurata madagascariensis]